LKTISSFFICILFSLSAYATPDISMKTEQGEIKLSDFKGKVVYLDFWASWCIPCRKSFPWMIEMQKRYGNEGFKIIAVNLDEEQDKVKSFLEKIPANFTIAYDPKGITAKTFKLKGMPSSYLIDRTGKIIFSHIGFRKKEVPAMEQKIKQLLEK